MAREMDVLLIGGGGREHALAWKLRQSRRVNRLYCAPGNGGIAELAELVPIAADDVDALADFAAQKQIGLTIVGPELPLTLGIVDTFAARGLRAFGPTRAGARLEGSKGFTKELLEEAGVRTARFAQFSDAAAAHRYLDEVGAPIVVKADGLAAGKGVYVCVLADEAHTAIDEMMGARTFGEAGSHVVIEDLLRGEEASFLALTDGTTVVPLASSQDHKRIFDGDQGPNTGGMGAISPAPVVTPEVERHVVNEILEPVVATLRRRGIVYKGILYAGLMIDDGIPSVLEFNVRFGDPECQPLMLRLQSDLVDVCEAVIDGTLAQLELAWDPRAAACVVVAAPGYPGRIEKGGVIEGLAAAGQVDDCIVFHAGTRRAGNDVVTDGGRVLGVTALGDPLGKALETAYRALAHIRFPGMQYRTDIGKHATARAASRKRAVNAGDAAITAAVAALRAGELVVFPTETLYGIGCDALNPQAIERLRLVKQRGADKGVAVIVADAAMLRLVSDDVATAALRLGEAFWPGPLTILLPARPELPAPLVLDGRVAARVSSHPVARRLARELGRPIASPSANPGGLEPARDIAAARAYFGPAVTCYIDDGPISGAPSTLVDPGPPLRVLREGAISRAALEAALRRDRGQPNPTG